MSITSTPTGRTRHRVHKTLLGKELVVLQVEWRVKGSQSDYHGLSSDVNHVTWQDARLEDISVWDAAWPR